MPPPATMFACVIFRVIDISVTMTFHGAGIMAHKARAAKKKHRVDERGRVILLLHIYRQRTLERFFISPGMLESATLHCVNKHKSASITPEFASCRYDCNVIGSNICLLRL